MVWPKTSVQRQARLYRNSVFNRPVVKPKFSLTGRLTTMNKDKCFDSIERGTRSLSHLFQWNFNSYYSNVWTQASNHRFPRMFNFLPEKVLLFVSPSCLPSRPRFPSLYGHLRISSWVKNNSKIDPSLETVSDYSSLYRSGLYIFDHSTTSVWLQRWRPSTFTFGSRLW